METRDKLFTEEQYIKQLAKYTNQKKMVMRLALICMDVYLIVEFILS